MTFRQCTPMCNMRFTRRTFANVHIHGYGGGGGGHTVASLASRRGARSDVGVAVIRYRFERGDFPFPPFLHRPSRLSLLSAEIRGALPGCSSALANSNCSHGDAVVAGWRGGAVCCHGDPPSLDIHVLAPSSRALFVSPSFRLIPPHIQR